MPAAPGVCGGPGAVAQHPRASSPEDAVRLPTSRPFVSSAGPSRYLGLYHFRERFLMGLCVSVSQWESTQRTDLSRVGGGVGVPSAACGLCLLHVVNVRGEIDLK